MKALQAVLILLVAVLSLVVLAGARDTFERYEARLSQLEARISTPAVDGYIVELRKDKVVRVPIDDPIAEARIERLPVYEGYVPDGYDLVRRSSVVETLPTPAPTPAPAEPKYDTPIPTPSNLWLGSGETPPPSKPAPMIGPAGNGKSRQEVLDGIPKGDSFYNFKAVEWDALNLSDKEWSEEYGTSPKLREEAPE